MWKIGDEVLVVWMNAMLGEIERRGVVEDVVEWCDDGIDKDSAKGVWLGGVEGCVE